MKKKSPWKKFNKRKMPVSDVLVTNNLKARDAHGRHSHIWWLTPVVSKMDNTVIGYTDSLQMIWGLTHYLEVDLGD